jgi:hypothetical protein
MNSSDDLWQQIYYLYSRDIYVGLQLNVDGVNGWITDKHFVSRADCYLQKGPGVLMGKELQRWLDEQAPKIRRGNGSALIRGRLGEAPPAR